MDGFLSGLRSSWMKRLKERQLAGISELFRQGIEGDKEAVKKAYALLTRLRRVFASDNLVEAYYGSILTLMGRDAVEPLERLEYVRQGLKILDNAVANEPDQIMIRSLRGYVCYRLPEVFFHRTATSVEDFTYLISRYEKEPGTISEEFCHRLLKDLESARKTLGLDVKTKGNGKKEGV